MRTFKETNFKNINKGEEGPLSKLILDHILSKNALCILCGIIYVVFQWLLSPHHSVQDQTSLLYLL